MEVAGTLATIAQSICTHYSSFENQGRFVTLQKNRAPGFLKKAGRVQKTKVIVIQKEKRQPGLFSFWITMTPFFAPRFFQVHTLDLIFFKFQTLKKYQVDLIN